MLAVEAESGTRDREFEAYDELTVGHHVLLLMEDGYLVGHKVEPHDSIPFGLLNYITWDGYEFLEAARNETIWKTSKKRVLDKVGAISVAVLKQVLVDTAKQHLGLAP